MSPDRNLVPIRRALLSVSDKAGLVTLARALRAHGVELVSTGGTARTLTDAGLPVTPVETLTGFPEMMDGRVKTLHPAVHGGLLALRDHPAHTDAMRAHNIAPIDLVCVNLYPFEQTVANPETTVDQAIEQIDIGGPSMIRSAAKNHKFVAVLTDPAQYDRAIAELDEHNGSTTFALRRTLAQTAFARTAAYDTAITDYFRAHEPETPSRGLQPARPSTEDQPGLPESINLHLTRAQSLRYGENPHQQAAVYTQPGAHETGIAQATQLAGKPLSYNNIADADAALELVRAIARLDAAQPAACVVKHMNPCGAAQAPTAVESIKQAMAGDPMAAFGGILACSSSIDLQAAEAIVEAGSFFEVIVAPAFDANASARLSKRWKNCRLLVVTQEDTAYKAMPPETQFRSIPGGVLIQQRDLTVPDPSSWTHAAGPAPSPDQLRSAAMLECAVRALSSNAVCIGGPHAGGCRLFGAGAGQMDRVASCKIAIEKAGDRAHQAVALSDAFFPFPDAPELLINTGVTMIVHPGGSKRDGETFDLCNTKGVTCMTTGVRHFRH